MIAPKLPSFFRTQKPKHFEYNPRYYDKVKDELKKRYKRFNNDNNDSSDRMDIISFSRSKQISNSKIWSNITLIIVIIVLFVIAYFIIYF